MVREVIQLSQKNFSFHNLFIGHTRHWVCAKGTRAAQICIQNRRPSSRVVHLPSPRSAHRVGHASLMEVVKEHVVSRSPQRESAAQPLPCTGSKSLHNLSASDPLQLRSKNNDFRYNPQEGACGGSRCAAGPRYFPVNLQYAPTHNGKSV